jgi:hypothetical protein
MRQSFRQSFDKGRPKRFPKCPNPDRGKPVRAVHRENCRHSRTGCPRPVAVGPAPVMAGRIKLGGSAGILPARSTSDTRDASAPSGRSQSSLMQPSLGVLLPLALAMSGGVWQPAGRVRGRGCDESGSSPASGKYFERPTFVGMKR